MIATPAFAPEQVVGLTGRNLPDVALPSTDGNDVILARLRGVSVIYAYPRTSPPDGTAVPGWAEIPGAKGCTPQSCGFRDHFVEMLDAGATRVFGLSTQSTDYQKEVVERLHLPFALLSDAQLALQQQLDLPVFEVAGMTLLHRLTLIVRSGKIERIFHSINEPAENAADVLGYLTKS